MSLSAPRREAKIQNTIEEDKDYIRFVEILTEQAAVRWLSGYHSWNGLAKFLRLSFEFSFALLS